MAQMSKQKIIQTSIAGILTGLMSLPFQHPFDSLKTNMQSRQTSLRKTCQQMVSSKGWRSFYNGFSMNCLRIVLKQGLRWPLWIMWAGFSAQNFSNSNIFIRESFVAFGITISQLIVLCPFQRVKTWLMTTQRQKDANLQKYFRLHANLKDLYAGFIPVMIRQGLSWSSFLIASSYFKEKWRQYKNYSESHQLIFKDLIIISIPVALTNTAFTMPIDCIKTFYQEYQSGGQKQKFQDIIQKRLRNNYAGLYFGWQARLIQYMIQSTFTLTAFEAVSHSYILSKKKLQQ